MAKEKAKVNDWELSLERVMFEVKNNGKPVLDKNGEPIIKPIFQMHLELLGKKRQFRIMAANESEVELLKDFFDLQGPDCNQLPVKIETVEFKDSVSGRTIKRNNVLVQLAENDDIHVLRLKPVPSEMTEFNMAIAEKAYRWNCPENIRKVRKERYEKVQEKKAAEIQPQQEEPIKGSGKKGSKKGEDLPF